MWPGNFLTGNMRLRADKARFGHGLLIKMAEMSKVKKMCSDLLWLWRGSQIFLVFTHREQGLEQLGHLRDQGLDCGDIRSSKPWNTCGQVGKEAKSKVEVCGERRQRWWNKDRCRKNIKGVHEAGKCHIDTKCHIDILWRITKSGEKKL